MKWTNPGHQLDNLGMKYEKVEKLFIYGNDAKAKKALDFLCWIGADKDFSIAFVLDITVLINEKDHTFCGKPIVPFQTTFCDEVKKTREKCVIAFPSAAKVNEIAIVKELGMNNIFYLNENQNRRDNFIQNFVCVWSMYKKNILISHSTNYLATAKCNLRCKHCLNYNNYITNPKHITFEQFREDVDTLFSKYDYLYSFHFAGGEPVLVDELPIFIQYLVDNYKDRIFEFFIITNGTIIPNKDLIAATKRMNGTFLVDDYSATVSNEKVHQIKLVLDEHEVAYRINKIQKWYDLDIENTNLGNSTEEELVIHKDSCNSYLQEFADKKFYACCYYIYAKRAGMDVPETTSNDYIDIEKFSKMEILEFRQGYTQKGYLEMCKQCRGIGACAKYVPAALQERKASYQAIHSCTDNGGNPLVSICVPVYNTSQYLTRCINSLLNQAYQHIEVILVDDGSTDTSGMICDDFAQTDSRVKVFHQTNKGEAAARNAGLFAATGDYVMFIDSDDEYLSNAVQLLVDAMKQEQVDLAIGGYLEKRGGISHFATTHQQRYTNEEFARMYLEERCQYSLPYIGTTVNAKLFRRELIQTYQIIFQERFVIGNDAAFICEYLQHARVIYDVLMPIYIYYKFQIDERAQGMSWFYPDGFFLFAYVADRMIKIANLDETTYTQTIIKQYKDFWYSVPNVIVNQDYVKTSLLDYFRLFAQDIDLLQIGAKLDLANNLIAGELGALPIRLIDYLIVNKNYSTLCELFYMLCKDRNVKSFEGNHIRQMIQVDKGPKNNQRHLEKETSISKTALVDVPTPFADELFMEQIDHLIKRIIASQKLIDEKNNEIAQLKDEAAHQSKTIVVPMPKLKMRIKRYLKKCLKHKT